MADILQTIITHKRSELENSRAPKPSLREALLASPTGIIAEFKRRSPSKGWIHEDASPAVVPLGYQQAGAAALSILTDEHFFGGKDSFIVEARRSGVTLPILYKNFVIDEQQLYDALRCGASAVLLIAACLTLEECASLMKRAHALGLEVLLEIHSESELPYAELPADCIGVNNRNLGTFVTDVQNSFRLADRLRAACDARRSVCCDGIAMPSPVLVSESGISDPAVIRDLRAAGFRGFLIGETFMREPNPARALEEFIKQTLQPSL